MNIQLCICISRRRRKKKEQQKQKRDNVGHSYCTKSTDCLCIYHEFYIQTELHRRFNIVDENKCLNKMSLNFKSMSFEYLYLHIEWLQDDFSLTCVCLKRRNSRANLYRDATSSSYYINKHKYRKFIISKRQAIKCCWKK